MGKGVRKFVGLEWVSGGNISEDELTRLIVEIRANGPGSQLARERFVSSFTPLIVWLAHRIAGKKNLHFCEDLVSVGCLAVLDEVVPRCHLYERKNQLSTYVTIVARGRMKHHLAWNSHPVALPPDHVWRVARLDRACDGSYSRPSPEDVMSLLGVKRDMAQRVLRVRQVCQGDTGESDVSPDAFWSGRDSFAIAEHHEAVSHDVHKAMRYLTELAKFVIRERWLGDSQPTLKEVSIKMGVSRERVRQIEKRAFAKMRWALCA